MADSKWADYLYSEMLLVGMFLCSREHRWGGITRESSQPGHQASGSQWIIYVANLMTVTSNTIKWIIQSFRVVGMGIKIIVGENAMWEPEKVNLLRD